MVGVDTLDAGAALRLGGWDSRHARVLFVVTRDNVGIALIDANGDGADLNLDDFECSATGVWEAGAASSSSGTEGAGFSGHTSYIYGRDLPGSVIRVVYRGDEIWATTSEEGWWAFVARRGVGDCAQDLPSR